MVAIVRLFDLNIVSIVLDDKFGKSTFEKPFNKALLTSLVASCSCNALTCFELMMSVGS